MTNEEKAKEIGKKCARVAMEMCSSEDECIQSAFEAMQWKDKQFQKVLDYAEICYGVFCFEQRNTFINRIKDIFYEEEKGNQKGE